MFGRISSRSVFRRGARPRFAVPVPLAGLVGVVALGACVRGAGSGPGGSGASALLAASAPAAAAGTSAPARGAVTDHVVVISIDGLRPDAIERFGAETLGRLVREGSYSLEATTILPSITLPSHTSMLTGTEPEVHGVTWNREEMEEHGHVATPTIFAAAHAAGFQTAAFFSKEKFRHLAVPGTLDHTRIPGWPGKWSAKRTVAEVEAYLARERPNLLFVHIGEPDFFGHVMGWMSTPYGWAVREADAAVGRILESADRAFGEGEYTVIVTADHGGHDKGHGSEDPRDVTIPWIVQGEGVVPGTTLPDGIRTLDTAATALWLLGVPAGVDVEGRPVQAAFTGAAVAAATDAVVAAAAGGAP